MAIKITFLALVVVNVLAQEQQPACTQESKGVLLGVKHQKDIYPLPEGEQNYLVEITLPCLMAYGMSVEACDPSGTAPTLTLPSMVEARVVRNGDLQGNATLNVLFYCLECDPPQNPPKSTCEMTLGVMAEACDPDGAAPTVEVPSLYEVRVIRRAYPRGIANLTVTFYCLHCYPPEPDSE